MISNTQIKRYCLVRQATLKFFLLCCCVVLWLAGYSHAAVSAVTSHFIIGSAPTFNPQLEQEIAQQQFSLLMFNYQGKTYGNSTMQSFPAVDPLSTIQDFIQHVTIAPMVLNEGDALDVDGDGVFTVTFNSASLTLRDKYNEIIDVSHTFCELVDKAPFTLHLNAALNLTTRYGVPNTTAYNVSQQYLIPLKPTLCYLKPSLTYGSGNYAGVTTIWNPQQGFIYDASKTPFPTTGMDGLNFDIKVLGVDVLTQDINTIYSHLANVSLQLSPMDSQTLHVKLSGPTANNPKPFTANVFNILIGPALTYRFKINHWFIYNNDQLLTWGNANNWCNGLGGNQRYQLPAITQLSNASQDVSGQAGVRNYTRAIGQGLLPEWGSLVSYGLMTSHYIWSSTLRPNSGGHYYDTHNVIGSISSPVPAFQEMNLCVSK